MPGWRSAAKDAGEPLFRNVLLRTLGMDPKQRDSIALMRKSVSPWMRLVLRGITAPSFDTAFLDDPDATLFILAPAEGSIAGAAAVTLLDQLVRRWRAKTSRKEMMHRLLLCLLLVYVASLAVLQAERGGHDKQIRTLGDALWRSASTITTVGYGDKVPATPRGKVIAVLLMIGTIGLVGSITATLASWVVQRVGEEDTASESVTTAHIEELRAEIHSLRWQLSRHTTAGQVLHQGERRGLHS